MKCEVDPRALQSALKALDATRAGKADARPSLECMNMVTGEREIRFETADGFTLTRLALTVTPDEAGDPVTALLDWNAGIGMLTAALKAAISARSKLSCILTATADGVTLTTPEGLTATMPATLAYTFPRCDQLIPPLRKGGTHRQAFNAHRLARILKAVPTDGSGIVRVYMGDTPAQPARIDWSVPESMSATVVIMPMFVSWGEAA